MNKEEKKEIYKERKEEQVRKKRKDVRSNILRSNMFLFCSFSRLCRDYRYPSRAKRVLSFSDKIILINIKKEYERTSMRKPFGFSLYNGRQSRPYNKEPQISLKSEAFPVISFSNCDKIKTDSKGK